MSNKKPEIPDMNAEIGIMRDEAAAEILTRFRRLGAREPWARRRRDL